jgi:hypothetical protein
LLKININGLLYDFIADPHTSLYLIKNSYQLYKNSTSRVYSGLLYAFIADPHTPLYLIKTLPKKKKKKYIYIFCVKVPSQCEWLRGICVIIFVLGNRNILGLYLTGSSPRFEL